MTTQQLSILGAQAGAYSIVTKREATGDRSVTVDKFEKQPLVLHYTLNIFTRKGGGQHDGKSDRHNFFVHKRNSLTGAAIYALAINYAKSLGNELRLYMSSTAEFEGQENDVFFIYSVSGSAHPHVGFLEKKVWDNFWSKPSNFTAAVIAGVTRDADDEDYQRSIDAAAAGVPVQSSSMRYPRDPKVALKALKKAVFKCEIDASHNTFISSATGTPYVEAHHLIPMSAQGDFKISLDIMENITALCPNCHRHLHLGKSETRIKLIMELYSRRRDGLARQGIQTDLSDILKTYNLI